MKNYNFPTKDEIKKAVISFLNEEKQATTKEINQMVINKFGIPEKAYKEENEYGNTTIFAYRMCWIRTELRNEGYIENPIKGVWKRVGD